MMRATSSDLQLYAARIASITLYFTQYALTNACCFFVSRSNSSVLESSSNGILGKSLIGLCLLYDARFDLRFLDDAKLYAIEDHRLACVGSVAHDGLFLNACARTFRNHVSETHLLLPDNVGQRDAVNDGVARFVHDEQKINQRFYFGRHWCSPLRLWLPS